LPKRRKVFNGFVGLKRDNIKKKYIDNLFLVSIIDKFDFLKLHIAQIL